MRSKLLINMAREVDFYHAKANAMGVGEGYAKMLLARKVEAGDEFPVTSATIELREQIERFRKK